MPRWIGSLGRKGFNLIRKTAPFVVVALLLASVGYWRESKLRAEARAVRSELSGRIDHLQSDVAAVGPQVKTLDATLASVQLEVESLGGLQSLRGRLAAAETALASVESELSSVSAGTLALGNDFGALSSQLQSKVSLADVQAALSFGELDMPASAIQVPLFCLGKVAVWSSFGGGLTC